MNNAWIDCPIIVKYLVYQSKKLILLSCCYLHFSDLILVKQKQTPNEDSSK